VQSPLTGEERAKVCARFGLPASGKLVVAVGRLAKVKGHGHLIAAAGKLAPRFPQTTFVVVGAGSEGPRLQQQAREIGVAQQVHWLGHQPDVTPLLAVADVFVLPSLSEGMSNALMEAMAAGCPVVATDVGSNSELLQHGRAGRLVRGGDEAGLVDAMGELLADPKAAQALGREARAAIAPFSVGRMVQQYEELYEEIAIAKRQ
jgi:glycosyltransferase involved in cell wall biosynthesis